MDEATWRRLRPYIRQPVKYLPRGGQGTWQRVQYARVPQELLGCISTSCPSWQAGIRRRPYE